MRQVALVVFFALVILAVPAATAQGGRQEFGEGAGSSPGEFLNWSERDNLPGSFGGSSFERNNPARRPLPIWAQRGWPPEIPEERVEPYVPIPVEQPPVEVMAPPEIWVVEPFPYEQFERERARVEAEAAVR